MITSGIIILEPWINGRPSGTFGVLFFNFIQSSELFKTIESEDLP